MVRRRVPLPRRQQPAARCPRGRPFALVAAGHASRGGSCLPGADARGMTLLSPHLCTCRKEKGERRKAQGERSPPPAGGPFRRFHSAAVGFFVITPIAVIPAARHSSITSTTRS